MPMSDKEEMQMVKVWWKEYGYYILFSLLLVIVAKFAWHYWQKYQGVRLEQASVIYIQMMNNFDQKKNEEAKLYGEKLIKDYASSPYASFAALILAKDAVNANNLQLAEEKLQFVIKKAPNKKIRQLARIRAARVLIAMKQVKDAIALLGSMDDKDYVAEVNEVLGDAFLAIDRTDEAKQAYRKASEAEANKKPPSLLLKMKMLQF